MVRIRDIASVLESWAPRHVAQSYDNVGLQIGWPDEVVRGAVIALDLTPAVLQEAQSHEAQLIITHHPLIFRPLKRLGPGDWASALALRVAQSGIALYSIHTNLDAAPAGVSFALAEQLGLAGVRFLEPFPGGGETSSGNAPFGMGAIGRLPHPEPLSAFLARTALRLNAPALRYVGNPDQVVQTIAVCGGSGSGLFEHARQAGADAFVTADVTYHKYFDALREDGTPHLALIDAGHYETEHITEHLLAGYLRERFPGVAWHPTSVHTNPVRTFVASGPHLR